MIRTKLLLASVSAAVLLLAGCGSDSDSKPDASSSATTEGPAATAAPDSGEPVPATSAPDPAASPEPATTSTGPTGTMLDYETGDDSGVVLTTATDVDQLKGSPADFRSFIAGELAAAKPEAGCTEKPQIYVTRVDTMGWARGGYFIPQCGGGATLWAKSGGAWQEVWSGQSLVECTTLARHRIPPHIAGSQCLDGEDTVDYTG
jgi:outer membrane murein-binding lipoprotein Lpp